ncbi:MAG: (2Fe-2S)-binding protein [Thermomicrobiales bacterium]
MSTAVAQSVVPVDITVNGVEHHAEVEPRQLLVHFLRETLGLTGTHVGCAQLLRRLYCPYRREGRQELHGLHRASRWRVNHHHRGDGLQGNLHPVQEGFWEEHGLQCGYCTPGMIMAAAAFLETNSDPTEAEIRHALEGNLCRCTGYQNIVKAIQYAAKKG